MKLKYYLNGFGIGVLFATIILSVSFLVRSDSGTKMTDEEVMVRARQLGMEMSTAATEAESATKETAGAETSTRPEKASETESSKELETTEAETSTTEETTTEEPTTEPPTTEAQTTEELTTQMQTETQSATTLQSGESITIEIVSGMTSETVSRMLADRGLISSASELNTYMVQKGQAGRIRVGKYEMTPGMSYDEIISMICR